MSDLIDRQEAIDYINASMPFWSEDKEACLDCLNNMPSAETPTFDEWCTDCKEYDSEKHRCPRYNRVIAEAVKEARENVRGEWIELYKDNYKCSVCGSWWTTTKGTPQDNGIDYCPNCGADMRGEEDVHNE